MKYYLLYHNFPDFAQIMKNNFSATISFLNVQFCGNFIYTLWCSHIVTQGEHIFLSWFFLSKKSNFVLKSLSSQLNWYSAGGEREREREWVGGKGEKGGELLKSNNFPQV